VNIAAGSWPRTGRGLSILAAHIEVTRIRMDWQAFWLTIRLAVVVAAILTVVGLPIAYWMTYSRWRWKFLVEAVVALPIVLPPTVLGFYVLVALGSRSPVGRWWQALTGHTLAFTFTGLVIGSIVYSLPFAVQPLGRAFPAASSTISAGCRRGKAPLPSTLKRAQTSAATKSGSSLEASCIR